MSDQKHIDRLFQEKFKDFEATPSEALWDRIATDLDQQKKDRRRVLPLWLRLGGVAALLALFIALGYNMLSEDKNEQVPFVEQNDQEKTPSTPEDTQVADTQNDSEDKDSASDKQDNEPFGIDSTNKETQKTSVAEINGTADDTQELPANAPKGFDSNKVLDANNKEAVANRDGLKRNKAQQEVPLIDKDPMKVKNATTNTKEVMVDANQNNDTKQKENNKETFNKKTIDKTLPINENEKEAVVSNESKTTNKTGQNIGIEKKNNALTKESTETKEAVAQVEQKEEKEKKSLLDAIKEKELDELDEAVAQEDGPLKRWSVNPMVAPVYFNTMGDGSPIHTQFSDNNKSGDINISYGVNVAYAINDRLSVRSGVNRVNLGYDTNGISFTPSLQPNTLETISYRSTTQNITVQDMSEGSIANDFVAQEASIENNTFNGSMKQEIGYIEVPMELKYRVVDKKLGVNVIGGVSTLFLTDNSVTLESPQFTTEVGEANNLNEVSFSTNIGVGVDYEISDKLKVNVEPMFKYQLNTFSNNEGNFKPYNLGVYTGLSFRF